MSQSTTPRHDTIRTACEITEAICHLPAVATLDWLDRAAAALRAVVTPSRVCVLIANGDANGAAVSLEAAGFAGLPAAPGARAGTGDADENNIDLTVRSRAERLDGLGFPTPDQTVLGRLSDLVGGGDWRTKGLGRMWQGVPAAEVLVAAEPLGTVERGRVMITQVAIAEPGAEAKPGQLDLLGAVHPLLVRRALMAIGATRATSSRWLTGREQEVLDLLVLGKSVRVIADELGRSPHTVHDHVKSLHRKLGASSRGELVARALGHAPYAGAEAQWGQGEVHTTRARPAPEPKPAQATPPASLPIEAYRAKLGQD